MTLENSPELIAMRSCHGRNATHMVLDETIRGLGQGAIDTLIRGYDLEMLWELNPCTKIESALMS